MGAIYRLQVDFHRAKTTQDITLMMALWDEDRILTNQGDPHSPYTGADRLRAFWLQSGSFTHRRFSLVPSFKMQIAVHGEEARLYFEWDDIGDFDLPSRFIAAHTFLAGTVRKVADRWVFGEITAGKGVPPSVEHDYVP